MNKESQNPSGNTAADSDEQNKNEEDLLAFSSKYKANVNKEEELKEKQDKQLNKKRKISVDSTSISFSQDNGNISANSKILNKNFDIKEVERRNSSPLISYYFGSDKFQSGRHKEFVDLKMSLNFVKKEYYFNPNFNLYYPHYKSTKANNIIKSEKLKSPSFNGNIINFGLNCFGTGIINNNTNDKININNFFPPPQNNINNMFYINNYQPNFYNFNYMNFNDRFYNNNININRRKLTYNIEGGIINNYFNNILNLNNNNPANPAAKYNPILFSYNKNNLEEKVKREKIPQNNEKKSLDKRKGDWLCPNCNNLNFAFRVVCNRCKLPKSNTDDNSITINTNKQK